jgi:hypothetical protein
MATEPQSLSSGMGSGLAQVLPGSQAIQRSLQLADRQGQQQAKDLKRITDFSGLENIDVFARDQEIFAKKGEDIRSFVTDNIAGLMGGDTTAMMEFGRMKDEYMNEAALSKQARDQFDQISGKLVGKKLEDYEGVEDFQKWVSTPGNYLFEGTISEKFKPMSMEEIFEPMLDEAMKTARSNERKSTVTNPDESTVTTAVEEFSEADADALIDRVKTDTVRWRSIADKFESLPQEEQNKHGGDPVEWFKDVYRDQLVVRSEQTVDKAARQKGLGDLDFGNGFAENKYYRFDYQKKPAGGERPLLGMSGGRGGIDEQIDFSGKRAGEIDKITFIEPGGKEEMLGRPVKMEKRTDGDWSIVVSVKDDIGGERLERIPYEKYKGELKKFGFDLNEFMAGVKGGETTQTTGFGEGAKKTTIDMSDIFK